MTSTFYVVQSPAHVTYYNYLYEVPEGDELNEVMSRDDPLYLGFTDADWDGEPFEASQDIEGPFATKEQAVQENSFYVE